MRGERERKYMFERTITFCAPNGSFQECGNSKPTDILPPWVLLLAVTPSHARCTHLTNHTAVLRLPTPLVTYDPVFVANANRHFHSNENQIKLFKNFTEHRLYQNIKLKKHKLSQLYYLVIPQSPYKKVPE
jgi:hypothetical protein